MVCQYYLLLPLQLQLMDCCYCSSSLQTGRRLVLLLVVKSLELRSYSSKRRFTHHDISLYPSRDLFSLISTEVQATKRLKTFRTVRTILFLGCRYRLHIARRCPLYFNPPFQSSFVQWVVWLSEHWMQRRWKLFVSGQLRLIISVRPYWLSQSYLFFFSFQKSLSSMVQRKGTNDGSSSL